MLSSDSRWDWTYKKISQSPQTRLGSFALCSMSTNFVAKRVLSVQYDKSSFNWKRGCTCKIRVKSRAVKSCHFVYTEWPWQSISTCLLPGAKSGLMLMMSHAYLNSTSLFLKRFGLHIGTTVDQQPENVWGVVYRKTSSWPSYYGISSFPWSL